MSNEADPPAASAATNESDSYTMQTESGAAIRFHRWRWPLWLLLAIAAGAGLRNYTVDNDLAEWAPQVAAALAVASVADLILLPVLLARFMHNEG